MPTSLDRGDDRDYGMLCAGNGNKPRPYKSNGNECSPLRAEVHQG